MRNLSSKEINALLQKHPDARKIAVENFLGTITNNGNKFNALQNLQMDAILFGWTFETQRAIKEGIGEACKK